MLVQGGTCVERVSLSCEDYSLTPPQGTWSETAHTNPEVSACLFLVALGTPYMDARDCGSAVPVQVFVRSTWVVPYVRRHTGRANNSSIGSTQQLSVFHKAIPNLGTR
jgi:hypothetical protein